jgi:hypothetical protein
LHVIVIVSITAIAEPILSLLSLALLTRFFSRSIDLPQSINHSSHKSSHFRNLHATHSIHLDACTCVQDLETFSELAHPHLTQVSQQPSYGIRIVEVVGGMRQQ